MRIPSGVTDQYIYFVAVDATDLKSREIGLSAFTVYRSRNGGTAAAYTTPTVNETDATNMPGVYELLLDEDMTLTAGNDSEEICLHITASGMAPVTRVFELYRPKITAGNTLGVAADGDISGNVDGNVVGSVGSVTGAVGSVTAAVTLPTIPANWITAAGVNAGALDGKGNWNIGKTGYSISGTITTLDGLNNFDPTSDTVTLAAVTHTGAVVPTVSTVSNAVTLPTIPANWITAAGVAASALDGKGDWNIGKTGYSLTQAFPANFADLSITLTTGLVDIGTGSGLSAIPWNSAWDAEVESECNDALVALHLDHLLAVDYDPAAKPGVATALLNELVESDAGVSRFTVNALENAPSGSGASAEAIADAVWDELQADHVTVGTFGIIASEIATIDTVVDGIQADLDNGTDGLGAIKADTAAILIDTNELQTDWTNGGRLDNILDARAAQATADAIETDTQDLQTQIGAAGAGLTAIPWNTNWDAEVQSECNDALVALNLDHLLAVAVTGPDVVDDSVIAKMVSSSVTADWDSFVNTTESLQAIRDAGDSAWVTAVGFSTHSAADVWAAGTRTLTGNANLNDPTAAAIADTVWDELQSAHVIAGSFGEIATEIASILADTGDMQPKLGTPATDLAADIAALNDIAASDVLTQVNAALDTAISELGVGIPTATPTLRTGLMLLYMALRNKTTVQTSGTDALEIYNDAGTMIAKKLLTDAGGDYNEAEMVSG